MEREVEGWGRKGGRERERERKGEGELLERVNGRIGSYRRDVALHTLLALWDNHQRPLIINDPPAHKSNPRGPTGAKMGQIKNYDHCFQQ